MTRRRAAHTCAQQDCDTVVPANGGPSCPVHTPRRRINRPSSAPYRTARWRRIRADFLSANSWCTCPGCPSCPVPGRPCIRPSTTPDHIIPRAVAGPNPDRPDNLQPRCQNCHSYKTATRDGGFGRNPR